MMILAFAAAAVLWLTLPSSANARITQARAQLAQPAAGLDLSSVRRKVRVMRRPVARPVVRPVARPVHSRIQSYRR